jgi:imidazolonepropionase-like amidohydrolase
MRLITLLSSVTILVSGVMPSAPAGAQQAMLYLRAGGLLDVERGRLLRDQAVVIEGDRIVRLGPASDIAVPAGAELVDLSEDYVLPGLIDAHVHLLNDADEAGFRRLANSVPRATIKGVKNARLLLLAGFTSARVLGSPGFGDVALRDGIDAGEVVGPRLRVAGPALGITGGHCSDNNLLGPQYTAPSEGVADGPWAVRAAVRRNIKYGADVIKTCSTGGVMSAGTRVGVPQYTLEELTALADEAHSHGLKVASHAHGAEGIRNAILAGIDSIEHASFIDDEGIALAKARGTTLVMDVYVTEYILSAGESAGILPESLEKERTVGQTQRDNFRKAHAAGLNIVFGTDAGVYPHGQNARQFRVMVEYGMTPWQAIQSATNRAAELLGTDADTGSLAPGKFADIVAVPMNPLEDIRVLEDVPFVMKGGVIYKDASRQGR